MKADKIAFPRNFSVSICSTRETRQIDRFAEFERINEDGSYSRVFLCVCRLLIASGFTRYSRISDDIDKSVIEYGVVLL